MFKKQLLRQSRTVSQSLSVPVRHSQFSSLSSRAPSTSFIRSQTAFQSRVPKRWQSTETNAKPAEGDAAAEAKETPKEDPTKAELEAAKKEVIDLKDKYLRSVADFRNLQDRTKRDVDAAKQFAIQRFAADLLDSIDNLDRALGAVPEAALGKSSSASTTTSNTSSADPNVGAATESTGSTSATEPNKDLLNLHSGLKMTETIMMNTLKRHGLERFDPMEGGGRKFNPSFDEATFFTKVEGKNDGDVFYTQSKGFTLNGRVIRAAKVGVVKNN